MKRVLQKLGQRWRSSGGPPSFSHTLERLDTHPETVLGALAGQHLKLEANDLFATNFGVRGVRPQDMLRKSQEATALHSIIADAVILAERIMQRIDAELPAIR